MVLYQQFGEYQQALNRLASSIESLRFDIPEGKAKVDTRQSQMQQHMLLQAHFHISYHLLAENIPACLFATKGFASGTSEPSGDSQYADTSLSMAGAGFENVNLGTALSKMRALLSQPILSPAQSTPASYSLASPSQRTYTMSMFLVGALYFLCLKTTSTKR